MGNGPVSVADKASIERMDIVIRLNTMDSWCVIIPSGTSAFPHSRLLARFILAYALYSWEAVILGVLSSKFISNTDCSEASLYAGHVVSGWMCG